MLKGDMKKQAIRDVAERLFFQKGYGKTTVQDFLDALESSKGSFYHHFESKLQVLTELCRLKAEKSFAAFQEQTYENGLERLNGLFYFAMPFRKGEEDMLTLLLPLQGLSDGHLVQEAILDAQEKLFFPEAQEILTRLKEEKTVFYTQPRLPQLLWDSYTAVYRHLMAEASVIQAGGTTGGVIAWIQAERFLWERLLDAPFGSVRLIDGEEVLRTIGHAAARLKRMDAPGSAVPPAGLR